MCVVQDDTTIGSGPISGSNELTFQYAGVDESTNIPAELSMAFDGESTGSIGSIFKKAASSCASYFGLQLGDRPIFLHLTKDATALQRSRGKKLFSISSLNFN